MLALKSIQQKGSPPILNPRLFGITPLYYESKALSGKAHKLRLASVSLFPPNNSSCNYSRQTMNNPNACVFICLKSFNIFFSQLLLRKQEQFANSSGLMLLKEQTFTQLQQSLGYYLPWDRTTVTSFQRCC